MYSIYIIKNKINNKIYIGQTKNTIKKRWTAHKSKVAGKSNLALHLAMRLHGVENFSIELIDKANNLQEANDKEIKFIKQYNSKCPNGYNMVEGGNVEILNSHLPKTEQHKNNIRVKHLKKAKSIIQFDIETGRLIKQWQSSKELKRAGYNRANIISICKKEQQFGYIYGYGWCYEEFYNLTIDKSLLATPNYNPHGKTIKSFDSEGNLVKIYYKIVDAAKDLNCSPSSIHGCLIGREKNVKVCDGNMLNSMRDNSNTWLLFLDRDWRSCASL